MLHKYEIMKHWMNKHQAHPPSRAGRWRWTVWDCSQPGTWSCPTKIPMPPCLPWPTACVCAQVMYIIRVQLINSFIYSCQNVIIKWFKCKRSNENKWKWWTFIEVEHMKWRGWTLFKWKCLIIKNYVNARL